jgi:hypothetical protein
MIRVEELTLRWLDGEADPGERDELARLVESDAEARRLHLTLVDVEVALRRRRPVEVSAAAAVMERIGRERADRAVWTVMSHLSSIKPVTRGPRATPARGRRGLAVGALVGLASVAAAFVGLRVVQSWDTGTVEAPAARPLAEEPVVVARRADPPVAARAVPSFATAPEAASSAGSAPAEGAIEVLAFDFESGEQPESFIDGHVVPGACGPGSQFCALGTSSEFDPGRNTVTVEQVQRPLFSFAPNQVLSFDYWVGGDAPHIRVQLWVRSRKENFAVHLRDIARDRWGHAEIRLTDLRTYGSRRGLTEGDGIGNIMLTAGRLGGAPFYVDNLRVMAYPARTALPVTSSVVPAAR